MENPRIVRIERGEVQATRPRRAGCNARLGEHGSQIKIPIVRLTAEDGSSGFGISRSTRSTIESLLGKRLTDVFAAQSGVAEVWRALEYPIWDWVCQRAGRPAYAVAAECVGLTPVATPLSVPCYDTSLYFDDLHLAGDAEAAALMAAEAGEGQGRGHRHFKIKIGRGARHMALEQGMRRDVAVVRAVRAAVGAEARIMVDANNGLNLNLAKRFLSETADCNLFWLEEAFHEDAVLYRDLREWMEKRALRVLIADGEGDASPRLLDWAREGIIDVVQVDIVSFGFTRWLELARQLDEWGCLSAPHHYGTCYGNYASCHLAPLPLRFASVEWDEAQAPALRAPGYSIHDGRVDVPPAPGFGLSLDEALFDQAVQTTGFAVAA